MPYLYIDETNYQYWTGAGKATFEFGGMTRILNAMDRRSLYGSLDYCKPLESIVPIIPRSEWNDRIKEKDQLNNWLSVINDLLGVPCKDQNSLGYCHAYGTVGALMTCRALEGQVTKDLSAESVGGPVTGWRNQGAMPDDDLRVLVERGACEQVMMDREHSLQHSRWKEGWEQNALNYKAVEVYDLDPRQMFDQLMTCVLLNIPTAEWFDWWGHHIQGPLRARYNPDKRKFDLMPRNSWGKSYGENGYFWMAEGYGKGLATPNGAFAVRVAKALAV